MERDYDEEQLAALYDYRYGIQQTKGQSSYVEDLMMQHQLAQGATSADQGSFETDWSTFAIAIALMRCAVSRSYFYPLHNQPRKKPDTGETSACEVYNVYNVRQTGQYTFV